MVSESSVEFACVCGRLSRSCVCVCVCLWKIEQIDKVNEDLKDTNYEMSKADYILKGMKSIGGAIARVFKKKPTREEEDAKDIERNRAVEAEIAEKKADAAKKKGPAPASAVKDPNVKPVSQREKVR